MEKINNDKNIINNDDINLEENEKEEKVEKSNKNEEEIKSEIIDNPKNNIENGDKKITIKTNILYDNNINIQKPKKINNEINFTFQKEEQKEEIIEKEEKEEKEEQKPTQNNEMNNNKQIQQNDITNQIQEIKECDKIENENNIIEGENKIIKQNIDNRPINLEKIQNIDEIAVGPKCSNFLELLEKNLQNDNYQNSNYISQIDNQIGKPIKKYIPNQRKKPEISIPKKNEIKKYKYYSDNFKEKDPYGEKLAKENKIKKAKEKAKNIEKNRQNIKNKEQEKEQNDILKSNNTNNNNKWSKAKFEILNDKEKMKDMEEKEDYDIPLKGLEFGGFNNDKKKTKF